MYQRLINSIQFLIFLIDETSKSIAEEPWKEKTLLKKLMLQMGFKTEQVVAMEKLIDLGFKATCLAEIIVRYHLTTRSEPRLNIIAQEIKKLSFFHESGFSADQLWKVIDHLQEWSFPSLLHELIKKRGEKISDK